MSDARDLARRILGPMEDVRSPIPRISVPVWYAHAANDLARAVLADDTADRLGDEEFLAESDPTALDPAHRRVRPDWRFIRDEPEWVMAFVEDPSLADDLADDLDRLARVEAEAKLLRECDCVAAVYSSLSCRKCGRPNVITAEMAAANDRRFGEMALRRAAVGDLARRALELYERTLDGCEQYTSEEPEHECFDVVFPALARAVLADETATCACGKDIWDAAGPEEQDSLIASGWHPGDPRECPVHGGRDIADDTADPDYSPAYQDEYQRLWHESAERLKEMAQWLADAQTEQLEIARLFPDAPVGASNLECVRSLFDWFASEKAENTRLRKLLATDPRAARSMCACAERCGDVPESEDHPLSVCKKLPR